MIELSANSGVSGRTKYADIPVLALDLHGTAVKPCCAACPSRADWLLMGPGAATFCLAFRL